MPTELEVSHRMPWLSLEHRQTDQLLDREWLVTNGLGGYASGSIAGACTRRYHGLLIAALPTPLGRILMLNHLAEELRLPGGERVMLYAEERPDAMPSIYGFDHLEEFRLEVGLPVWIYRFRGFLLEKRIVQPHRQNTTLIQYRLLEGDDEIRLRLRPSFHFRPHESPVSEAPITHPYRSTVCGNRVEVGGDGPIPAARMYFMSPSRAIVFDAGRQTEVFYRVENRRGYDSQGFLWSPGYFRCELTREHTATLAVSTEDWDVIEAIEPARSFSIELDRRQALLERAHPAVQNAMGAELVLAADQFIITPSSRTADVARARAEGDDVRSIIAGYHWFTDWGRDTMISLEGLTLATGRHDEARWILRTFAHYIRDGLIPNLFPEGEREGLYHTVDATLWYFHAIDRYVAATGDRATLHHLLPALHDIVDHHLRGTKFGIKVDPSDGLLTQGAEGYQLTWMDAKVDGWVVTPRRGKAVEINALWYNALRLLESWTRSEAKNEKRAAELQSYADQTLESFNRRFWYEEEGFLYDLVDGEQGDDSSFRPNQLFAIALHYPVLDEARWKPVLEVVLERLGTPVGLRTLAPGEAAYKPNYDGDLRARDAAYHQGTVWAWLVGPLVDAWLKVHPGDFATARSFLKGFESHLSEACIGSISEIFDAEAPYHPRGCIAQAWSVAEVLRCWIKTHAEKN